MVIAKQTALAKFEEWFDSYRPKQDPSALPVKGLIAVGLVILDRLRKNFDLNLHSHLAKGLAQIRGVSASALRRIMAEFGETRPFVKEAGRTNRGSPEQ